MVDGRARRCACPATTTSSCCASCAGATCRSRTAWPRSLAQLERASRRSSASRSASFLDGLVSHYVLDDGKLVVAHAGMKEEMQGRGSGRVREFALYGETTGETDEFGLPVRYNWAAEYRGPGDGRLRPHAGARAGVAEPHDQHRHRLRLRRQADGAALPRARAGLGAGAARPTAEPARPFLPRRRRADADRPAGSTTTCSTSTTCSGKRIIDDAPAAQRHRSARRTRPRRWR